MERNVDDCALLPFALQKSAQLWHSLKLFGHAAVKVTDRLPGLIAGHRPFAEPNEVHLFW